ncbi:MAG TPA: ribonuclease P protein component, partial [Mycobacterium sp.]|nr:ribonuclease P protein component [Mycobacterium sp.]
KYGRRAVQPDIVIHARHVDESSDGPSGSGAATGPRIGLIIAKSVGSAVRRHRVARRLRHVAMSVLAELGPCEQMVIRALPGSGQAESAYLKQQLRAGLQVIHRPGGGER